MLRAPTLFLILAAAALLAGCVEEAAPTSASTTPTSPSVPTVSSSTPTTTSSPVLQGPILFEGAEGPTDWVARAEPRPGFPPSGDSPGPTWHAAPHPRSGEHSWTIQDETVGRYRHERYYTLTSPPIELPDRKNLHWTFHYQGESEFRSGDEFLWQVSTDGTTFTTAGSTDAPAPDWTLVDVDLSRHAGKTVWLRLAFEADWCGPGTTYAPICGKGDHRGYFVDDILVAAG